MAIIRPKPIYHIIFLLESGKEALEYMIQDEVVLLEAGDEVVIENVIYKIGSVRKMLKLNRKEPGAYHQDIFYNLYPVKKSVLSKTSEQLH